MSANAEHRNQPKDKILYEKIKTKVKKEKKSKGRVKKF